MIIQLDNIVAAELYSQKERNINGSNSQIYTVRKWIFIFHLQFIPESRKLFTLEMELIASQIKRWNDGAH